MLVGTVLLVGGIVYALSDRTPADLVDDGALVPTASPPSVNRPEATATPDATTRPTSPAAAQPGTPQPGTPEPGGSTATATPSVEPVLAPVEVLNQTAVTGLAARASTALQQLGWTVTRVDNADLGTTATTVYVPSGLGEAGESLLRAVPQVTRARPAFEGLPADALTLVLAQPDAEQVVAALERDAADEAAVVGR